MRFATLILLYFFGFLLSAAPPAEIPLEFIDQFTMDGSIPVVMRYMDNSYPLKHPFFTPRKF